MTVGDQYQGDLVTIRWSVTELQELHGSWRQDSSGFIVIGGEALMVNRLAISRL